MNTVKFAQLLKSNVIDENQSVYNKILDSTDRDKINDEFWKNTFSLYDSLTNRQKSIFRSILCQISVDAVSSVLSVLDGNFYFQNEKGEFNLLYNEENVGEDLQDSFLELFQTL